MVDYSLSRLAGVSRAGACWPAKTAAAGSNPKAIASAIGKYFKGLTYFSPEQPTSSLCRDASAPSIETLHAFRPTCCADEHDHDVYTFLVRDLANLFRDLLLVVVDAMVGPEKRPRLF